MSTIAIDGPPTNTTDFLKKLQRLPLFPKSTSPWLLFSMPFWRLAISIIWLERYQHRFAVKEMQAIFTTCRKICVTNGCFLHEIVGEVKHIRSQLENMDEQLPNHPVLAPLKAKIVSMASDWDRIYEILILYTDAGIMEEYSNASKGIEDTEELEDIRSVIVGKKLAKIEGAISWESCKRGLLQ